MIMHAGLKSKKIALFGLGEAGSLVAIDMQKAGNNISAYDPKYVATPAGVDRVQTPSEAVADADVVVALTAGDDALGALDQAITDIPSTALYADFSTNSASAKLAMADRAARFGFEFVDVALMTLVPGKGLRTPVTVAGTGALRFEEIFSSLGMPVHRLDGNAGDAATRKLLRSVMMKGLAAVIIESMRAGKAAGCSEWVWENLSTEIAQADEAFITRLVSGTQPHAHRRLHEMECSAELLKDLGIEPTMTLATLESLKSVIRSGVPEIPPIL
jgi:3-hydroxyisobutyrate dehydrogenase-like beta-hydroxyacid dehydrogenase